MRKNIHNIRTSVEFLERAYHLIQTGGYSDVIYHYDSFGSLPIDFILETLRQINEQNKITAQLNSYTAAQLTYLVYSYLAGDSNEKIDPRHFLPGWTESGKEPLSDYTFEIIDKHWGILPKHFKAYIGEKYSNRLGDN